MTDDRFAVNHHERTGKLSTATTIFRKRSAKL
jgi:hypothetical protein